jgi:hypothetical protein
VCAPSLSDYISRAEFPVRIFFIFNFPFSAVSSGIFLSCRIFYSIFSRYFMFRFHVTVASAIFRTILHQMYILDVAYKKPRRIEKEPSQVREAHLFLCVETCSDITL